MRSSFLVSFLLISVLVYSQTDYYTEDYVYTKNIKSVKFFAGNNPLNYPVSNISGNPRLFLSFDDLDADNKDLYYSIIHCDKDWNISNLEEPDFLDGFNREEIKNKSNSTFTLKQYTHYSLSLPNSNTRWLISGNYILIVFDENDEAIITKKFLVTENNIGIDAFIEHSKDVTKFNTHQSLNITLNIKNYNVVDPLKEFFVTALQNNKWLDAVTNVKPKYLVGDECKFDAFDPFLFKAQNEFRYFDTRTLNATNLEIHSIDINRRGIDVVLEKDKIRKYGNYFFHKDINGNFLILNNDNPNPSLSGQYTNIYFTLETLAPVKNHDVYVIGGFCDWQLYDENKLQYDESDAAYKGKILLKQGVYDYYYALVDSDENIDISALEGSWFETENDYMILVYERSFGGRYDKLVGIRIIE